jgi:hypothetical protein
VNGRTLWLLLTNQGWVKEGKTCLFAGQPLRNGLQQLEGALLNGPEK